MKAHALVSGALVLLAGCACLGFNSAERRARRYFQIPSERAVDSVSIREGLQRAVPLGTPDSVVIAYLASLHIFADPEPESGARFTNGKAKPLDRWWWAPHSRELVVGFPYDPRQFCLVCWDFNVGFAFDDHHRLMKIEVSEGLTGL